MWKDVDTYYYNGGNKMKRYDLTVTGLLIYDPRSKTWDTSDNPALVMADMARRGSIKASWNLDNDMFWDNICKLADYCDDRLEYNNQPGKGK